ncbi:MAG: hypothetical protein EBZ59_13015 [Planctomycetia bacterium]|nr:hypothetical protein [Planctomycetia bacterium]
MPRFELDGETFDLQPQPAETFRWLASQVYRRMHDGTPLPAMLVVLAHHGRRREGFPVTDQRVQAIVWTLWQMGIGSARIEGEGADRQAKWDRGEQPAIDSRPIMENFTADGERDGRALAAALLVAQARRIAVNGIDMPVRLGPIEALKDQGKVFETRQAAAPQQPPFLTAAACLVDLLGHGAEPNDPRVVAALEIAGDLGIRAIDVDYANRQVRISGFNEQAVLAAAYFQGAPASDMPMIAARAQAMTKAAMDAAGEGGPGTGPGAGGPGKPQQPFKPRRR